jgi:hypothetical protein
MFRVQELRAKKKYYVLPGNLYGMRFACLRHLFQRIQDKLANAIQELEWTNREMYIRRGGQSTDRLLMP